MKRAMIAVMLLAGVAQADLPAGLVKAPAGWAQTAEAPRAESAVTASHRASFRPAAPGAILYVSRVEIKATDARRDAIASAELAELEAAVRRQGSGATIEQQTKRADASRQQLDATLHWRDAAAGLADHSRTIVAATPSTVVAITGQCVLATDAPAALVSACDAALGTLEVDIAGEVRVALAIVGGGDAGTTAPPAPEPEAPPPSAGSGGITAPPPAQLRDGTRTPMAPIVVKQPAAAGPDRRPIYAGIGLIVFAALFYWNRRRRERFDKDRDQGAADE